MQLGFRFRFAPLFLAFIFFMNVLGVFIFAFAEAGLHRIAERMNDTQEKTQLILSAQEFKNISWIGEKDFIYNDQVYDLRNISVKDDRVFINCTSDKEETGIRQSVADNFGNESKKNIPSPFKDIFKVVSGAGHSNELYSPVIFYSSSILHSHFSVSPVGAESPISVPPPELG
ncbi:MAG: hypothetical protein HY064_15990 [Bacteroidetes bacterium]|nr:hypothetical protein [Bacteroidota bacterium]